MRALLMLLVALAFSPVAAAGQYPLPFQSQPDASITDGTAQAKLDAAKRRWARQHLSDYDFQTAIYCYCAGPNVGKFVTTRVRDGRAQTRRGPTVPKLFADVQRAIRRKVARLEVRYSPRTGLPRLIQTDGSTTTADDEFTLKARRLHAAG